MDHQKLQTPKHAGIRTGAVLQHENETASNMPSCHAKVVFCEVSEERRWQVINAGQRS
jgi:hypothetical protein